MNQRRAARRHARLLGARAICIGFMWALTLSGCLTEYQFNRVVPERGTFGEEVYQILHRDTTWSPRASDARRALLERERLQMVTAFDLIVTEEQLSPLEETLRLSAPLQDSGLVPDLTRKLALLLRDFSTEERAHRWLVTRRDRDQDRADQVHSAALEHFVSFTRLEELIDYIVRLTREYDGYNVSGQRVYDEPATVTDLIACLIDAVRGIEGVRGPRRWETFLSEVLLWSDPLLSAELNSALDSGTQEPQEPQWVVRLDSRGLPNIQRNINGEVYAPFADRNGDGLADVDERGAWVDFFGVSFTARAFEREPKVGSSATSYTWTRDELGRALIDGQTYLFDYVDLTQTALSFLLSESAHFIERDVIFDLMDLAPALLPPQVYDIDDQGRSTSRYPLNQNAPLELLYAVTEVALYDRLDELLEVGALLLRDHRELLAATLLNLQSLSETLETYPDAELTPRNTLLDDLVEVSAPLMTPETLLAITQSLKAPVMRECRAPLIDLLSYHAPRAAPPAEGLYDTCFQSCEAQSRLGTVEHLSCVRNCPRGEIFVEQLSTRNGVKRSHWERTLALFRTTSGVSYEMKVLNLSVPFAGVEVDVANTLPPLLRIDDVAAAYIQAVAGELALADYVTEEALASDEVQNLLLGGIDRICRSGAFESVVTSLVSVTADELAATCDRFERASQRTDLTEDARQRLRIAVMITLLSRLTDVSIDERPSAGQLTRFFNSPNPSLDLSVASLSLSQLVDQDGYLLWEHHGDMLYAVEASGLLDCIQPLFEALTNQGQAATFARLASTLDAHYPTPEMTHLTAEGTPAPRVGSGTGVIRFEEPLRSWLTRSDLLTSLSDLVLRAEELRSSRDSKADELLAAFIAHMMRSNAGYTRRDGVGTHTRVDGREVALSPFWLLIDVLDQLRFRLESTPQAPEKWERVVEALSDRILDVDERDQRFARPGWITLAQGMFEIGGRWARDERDSGQLREVIRGELYQSLEAWLLGSTPPLLLDLYQASVKTPGDRALLREAALHLTSQRGQRELTLIGYETLAELSDEESVVELAHLLGVFLDPRRAWEGLFDQRPLISHGVEVLSALRELAPNNPLISLARASLTRSTALSSSQGDLSGEAPLWRLLTLLADYHRVNPEAVGLRSPQDYTFLGDELSSWLIDDERGLEQLYELVQTRKR